MQAPLFYKNKPLFAIDVGRSTVKVAQVRATKHGVRLVGYGFAEFDEKAIEGGVITKPDLLKTSLKPLVDRVVIGKLTTDRVVASIPTANIFLRIVELQNVSLNDLQAAVDLEAQQYIPLPVDEIYVDHTVLSHEKEGATRVMMVATPKNIIASYLDLFADIGIEVAGFEPSLLSIIRSVNHSLDDSAPKIIIDFGSESSDLAIFDENLQLTSTIATGGDHITKIIAEKIGVDTLKAREIKSRYGIGKSKYQEQLAPALSPLLGTLADEVQKMLRYHHDHSDDDTQIAKIAIVGGGANLPGLDEFLTHLTGVEVTTVNPWDNIQIKPLQPPHRLETTLYTTAVGLALKETER